MYGMGKKQGKKPTGSTRTGVKPGKREVNPVKPDGTVVQPNQWRASEKQLNWLNYYMNPKEKETYANSYQSAIKAGYSETYARNIMNPSLAVQWVQSARNIMRTMNPEHIRSTLEDILTSKMEKASDRIAAAKLLGTDQGMFVQKQITAHVGLEEALEALE
mgnify:CR=1 FL=1